MSRKAVLIPDTTGRNPGASLRIDSEDHDLELVRSVADAIRTNPEVADTLHKYAEVRVGLDEQELQGRRNSAARLALEDEATDLLSEAERDFGYGEVGGGAAIHLTRAEVLDLYHALGDFLIASKSTRELATDGRVA